MPTHCRDARGERLADVSHGRQLDESPIELLEAGAPGGGALTGGRPLRPGAVFRCASLLELDATPCHACLRGSVVGLDAVYLRLGGIVERSCSAWNNASAAEAVAASSAAPASARSAVIASRAR